MKKLITIGAYICSVAAFADTPLTLFHTGVNWGSYYGPANVCWTNSAGTASAWVNGATAVIQATTYNCGFKESFEMGGLKLDFQSTPYHCWWDGNTSEFRIGSGGLEFCGGASGSRMWELLATTADNNKVTLTENQTWRGTAASTVRLAFGNNMGGSWAYTKARVMALNNVTDWTIENDMIVLLYAANNDLANTCVTVNAPAKLFLADMNNSNAQLHAKRLVLSGNGERMAFGVADTVADRYGAPTSTTMLDTDHLAPVVELRNGANITVSGATFALTNLVVAGGESVISGSGLTISPPNGSIDIGIAGSSDVLGFDATGNSMANDIAFNVSGSGTIRFKMSNASLLSGAFVLGADTGLVLTGEGSASSAVTGGKSLTVASDGVIALAGSLSGYSGNEIAVTSGSLRLSSMAALPSGVSVRTTGTGEVRFSSRTGYDESRILGTQNVVFDSDLYVTDAVIGDASLTISADRVVHVLGNGLTAATDVVLDGGRIVFEKNGATIASAVTVTKPSYIEASSTSVTGGISGSVTSQISADVNGTNGLWCVGSGCVVFSGGGTFTGDKNYLKVAGDSSVKLTNGDYLFSDLARLHTVNVGDTHWGRYIGVVDGGRLVVSGTGVNKPSFGLRLWSGDDGSTYSLESVFEVGANSSAEFGADIPIEIASRQSMGRIVLNGGSLKVGGLLRLGFDQLSTGVIEINSGVLELCRPIVRYAHTSYSSKYPGQGRIVWNGGTIKVSSTFPTDEPYLIRNSVEEANGENRLRVWTRINGACELDLTDLTVRETPIANVPAGVDRAEWFGTGTLIVKGGKTVTMNSFADRIGLTLADDGTRVVLPADAQVFDNATCLPNLYVKPYAGGTANVYSTTNTVLQNLAIASFAATGLNVSFSSERSDRTVALTTAQVTATGEFNSATTLTSAGTLTVGSLSFADNAVLSTVGGTAPFTAMTISLPSNLRYRYVKVANGTAYSAMVAFHADESLSGSPAWNAVSGKSWKPRVVAAARNIVFEPQGARVIIW